MNGNFFKGVIVGSVVGVAIAKNWEEIVRKCPKLNELKNTTFFEDDEQETEPKRKRYKSHLRRISNPYDKSRDL